MYERTYFSVDVPLEEDWLVAALSTVRAMPPARVTVVIGTTDPRATYKAAVLGGGDVEFITAAMAGDFTQDSAWKGG